MSFPTKRILVTGGAGFLGSHLCTRLLDQGHEVLCLDNFSTGFKRNVYHLMGKRHFERIRHDVTTPIYVEVDQIYHLACPASPVQYQKDPIQTWKTCLLGTLHMLGLAKRTGARMVQASTSEVYGDAVEQPQHEDYTGNVRFTGPRACYDEGKRAAETACADYQRQHGVDVRVARIFNTYGPRMAVDDGRVVSTFIVKALKGRPLLVHGHGAQTRSFCYVDDMVDGLIRIMEHDFKAPDRGPINLGDPENHLTISALAHRIIAQCQSDSPIDFVTRPVDDPTHRQPDISRARRILGFDPQTPLALGLSQTIAYFRAVLSAHPTG